MSSHHVCVMEAKDCSQQWKRRCSPLGKSPIQAVKEAGAEQRGPQKSVTLAPTSRYLTDRQYVMRRPLFSAQHTSILKKTHAEDHTDQKQTNVIVTEAPNPAVMNPRTSPRKDHTLTHRDLSPLTDFRSSTSLQCSLSSSVLQGQRLNTPVRPRLSSPVLYPTYTPRSGCSRRTQTSTKHHTMSPLQANYWACVIPNEPAPSAGTDPNRDYEALLDYTYPLKPGLRTERDRTQPRDPLNQTDLTLQDSGIELDHLSRSLSGLNLSFSGMEHTKDQSKFCVGQRSPDLIESPFPGTSLSPTEQVLSLDSLDWYKEKNSTVAGHHSQALPSVSAAFVTLPRDIGVRWSCEEEDEEFRPLPEQLEALQQLSKQVKEVTAQLSSAHWDCLEPGSLCISSHHLCPPPIGQGAEGEGQDTDEGDQRTAPLSTDHTVRTGASVEPLRPALSRVGLDTHRGLECQKSQDSLMEHISVFCCHLEQLVRWLYVASKKIKLLAAPAVDIHSVKLSLAQYQSFQRDVSNHMPLTSSVLQTGHLLLNCINSTSPVLRDTLLLIETQSRLVESHTECFFSSILSAMDSLTQPQPSPDLQSKGETRAEPRGRTRARQQEPLAVPSGIL